MFVNFGGMIVEMKKVKSAENLDYAMGLQFLERLEKSGKVNAVEKKILRDILEDVDDNPREGETRVDEERVKKDESSREQRRAILEKGKHDILSGRYYLLCMEY